jgi:hypothetical protein
MNKSIQVNWVNNNRTVKLKGDWGNFSLNNDDYDDDDDDDDTDTDKCVIKLKETLHIQVTLLYLGFWSFVTKSITWYLSWRYGTWKGFIVMSFYNLKFCNKYFILPGNFRINPD